MLLRSTDPFRDFDRLTQQVFGPTWGTTNRPAVMPVPGLVLDLKFGREFGQVLRGGQRVFPRRALDLGYEFRFTEVDAALADLL